MTESDDNARHRAKMEKRKAVQDAEVASKTIVEKGLLIVHTGPGKGKSTAAFGLMLRALGRGFKVGVVQFIKGGWETGERLAFARFGDQVVWRTMGEGFTWETQDRARDVAAAAAAWKAAEEMMADPSIRLLVLDELNVALRYDYLPLDEVVAALRARRPDLHVVVTGRNAKPELIEAADLVTEMGAVKHHFAAGVKAQAGNRVLIVARALMLQGTGSDVGKSLIVAGLCRALTRRGLKVRPFKPQNMSNNAAVTAEGGEIGRAQALQALACGVEPSVHMNPVLLKPQSEIGSQIVVQGLVAGAANARDYQSWKPKLLPRVLDSFARLKAEADIVLVEGAGGAAEINLRVGDIANMGFAQAAGVPVVVIGDIDRGGVIAQIVGTRVVLDPADAARVGGFLVNKFRGDPSLFEDGMRRIEALSGWSALGLIPHFPQAARLPAEDALALDRLPAPRQGERTVVVPRLPHISNFDDFDPLQAEPGVRFVFAQPGAPLPAADLIILPGSKATIADLKALRAEGWDIDILAHARRGGKVLGLCGGYQMLGRSVADPEGIEGPPETVAGLRLLDAETVLGGAKTLTRIAGRSLGDRAPFQGYEIHVGRTETRERPLLAFADGREDGAESRDGRVRGCYVHGLFGDDAQRRVWLAWIGAPASPLAYERQVEATLDGLAEHLERHARVDAMLEMAR